MLKRIGFLILSLLLMTGCTTETKKKSFNIVVTNFPCYDFVRAITKNDPDISIKMLIKPGMDSHSYEPTPQDMVAIKESDLFFYVGGESDDWVDSLLADMDSKRIVKMHFQDVLNRPNQVRQPFHTSSIRSRGITIRLYLKLNYPMDR